MTFPTIPTVAGGRVLTSTGTTCASGQTFPTLSSLTKNAGDLLIAIVMIYDGNSTNAEFSSWGGGFTEFGDFAGTATVSIGVAYKWSTGSETGTFTVTSSDTSTNDYACILLSIPGANAVTIPEAGGYVTGTATAADPGSLNPANWDVEDTLWIAVAGIGETSLTGSFTGVTAAPSGYSDFAASALSADAIGGVMGGVAFLKSAAASVDPGAFTSDTSNSRWGAITIAVRPVVNGALAGTSTTDFSAGSSTMAGTGALAGTSTASFTPAAAMTGDAPISGTLTASFTGSGTVAGDGILAGASTASFTGSGTMESAANEALAGTVSVDFAPVGAMAGEGALAGTSSSAFTTGGTLAGAGALAGSLSVDFAPTASLGGDGALAGASTASFTGSATAAGSGALAGASSVDFTGSGTVNGSGALAGASTVAFSLTGTTLADGALAGSSLVEFSGSGTFDLPPGEMAGSSVIAFAPVAVMAADGALAGSSSLAFTPQGALLGDGPLAGSSTAAFSGLAAISGAGALAGSSGIAFTGSGSATAAGATGDIAGVCTLTFTATLTYTVPVYESEPRWRFRAPAFAGRVGLGVGSVEEGRIGQVIAPDSERRIGGRNA